MPHRQKHRGQHQKDQSLFGKVDREKLGQAALDLHYLLTKGYGEVASVKIVGDRYALKKRQRFALRKIVSAQPDIEQSKSSEVDKDTIKGSTLLVDGFNVLILAEVLLSGGFVFECLDHTFRDIASIHGNYYRVEETESSIKALGRYLQSLKPKKVIWYFDSPVSNSGRIKSLIVEHAFKNDWPWQARVVSNPDRILVSALDDIVVSSDRVILTRCRKWFNLSKGLIRFLDLSNEHIVYLKSLSLSERGGTLKNR